MYVYLLLIGIGATALYNGIKGTYDTITRNDIYEESRRNRVRLLNQGRDEQD